MENLLIIQRCQFLRSLFLDSMATHVSKGLYFKWMKAPVQVGHFSV